MKRFFSTVFVGVALFLPVFSVNAQTFESLLEQVDSLIKETLAVQSRLQSLQTALVSYSEVNLKSRSQSVAPAASFTYCPSLTRDLYRGLRDKNTNGEVSMLQKFLAQDRTLFSKEDVTGYFGVQTERAVKTFQTRNAITGDVGGKVGAATRVVIKNYCNPVVPATPSGTIDPGSLNSTSSTPIISGSALNVTSVGISIAGSSGDKIWGSGNVAVANNRWSIPVTVSLPNGTFTVDLYSASNIKLATGVLTIAVTTNQPTLTVMKDLTSPQYAVAAAGSLGVNLGMLRVHASGESISLQRIALQLTSGSPSSLSQISLWDGTTQIGAAIFTGTSRYATTTLVSPVTIPQNSSKLITIKGDFATIGISGLGVEGDLIAIDYDGDDSSGTRGTGLASGVTMNSQSPDTAVSGVRVFKSYPIFTYSTTSATAFNGVNELLTLNVLANSSGDVQLNKLSFTVDGSTFGLTSPTLTGPNGSVGTVTISGGAITVTFNSSSNISDRIIAAGQTKNYILRGVVALTGPGGTGTLNASLKADASYPNLSTLMSNTAGLSSSNLIWSPNSTAATSSNNWTNSYGLPGCFALSGLGQSCTPRVISN